ncbi:hypothetical protein [Nonlabens ulvanivorans]|uniref:hypothetical protein n=1 Tax=Nonlabens ulvanivorans TaxID=906888 RepID=UPI002942F24D|nr:hypothetical protein [Nonlabens ulvanivorans]WOI23798.1 hypothetical protein R1T42_04915 [Nonlabens ulvanivorans]
MNDKKSGVMLIALGSAIVFIGIVLYLMEIIGATGMILLGIAVELAGAYIFWKNRKC